MGDLDLQRVRECLAAIISAKELDVAGAVQQRDTMRVKRAVLLSTPFGDDMMMRAVEDRARTSRLSLLNAQLLLAEKTCQSVARELAGLRCKDELLAKSHAKLLRTRAQQRARRRPED